MNHVASAFNKDDFEHRRLKIVQKKPNNSVVIDMWLILNGTYVMHII